MSKKKAKIKTVPKYKETAKLIGAKQEYEIKFGESVGNIEIQNGIVQTIHLHPAGHGFSNNMYTFDPEKSENMIQILRRIVHIADALEVLNRK